MSGHIRFMIKVSDLLHNEAVAKIDGMLDYTAEALNGQWEMSDEEIVSIEIDSGWGVKYDLEQMLEHAIVHILRHRRQIERLIGKKVS
jgi:hypothetical protein